jgi:hypothetical protein
VVYTNFFQVLSTENPFHLVLKKVTVKNQDFPPRLSLKIKMIPVGAD